MFVIAGLGNPEARYARNRHNIGFQVVEAFADKVGADPWRSKFHGEIARCRASSVDVLLVRPMTFMNCSGQCLQAVLTFFRVPITDLVVVHDELDLPFGTLRLKPGGGHAGHNGLRSVVQHLGCSDFARLRFGIGRPPEGFRGEVADFVLSDFSVEQRAELPEVVDRAVKSLQLVLRRGLSEATKSLNTRPKPAKAGPKEAGPKEAGPKEAGPKKTGPEEISNETAEGGCPLVSDAADKSQENTPEGVARISEKR